LGLDGPDLKKQPAGCFFIAWNLRRTNGGNKSGKQKRQREAGVFGDEAVNQ
jgi:hypothetical protein